ncbi:MAG: hypothetical protein MI740_10400 [Halanaerobiales bacterium]|nr:hypothetical protein [Halanaerobiales bacterium]
MAVLDEINGRRYFYWTDDKGLEKDLIELQLPDRIYKPGDVIVGWEYSKPVIFAGYDGERVYFELTKYTPRQRNLFSQQRQRLFEPAGIVGDKLIIGRHSLPELVFSVNYAAFYYVYDATVGGWRFRGRPSSPAIKVKVRE